MLKFEMAPLEGLTGYIFRRTYQEFFGGIDTYYTPFLSPNHDGGVRSRERNDVLPAHNTGMHLVPQILTNHADSFVKTAEWLSGEYGYGTVNLNLGCPSGTVVAKKKGSGLLDQPELLERLLDGIFASCPTKISIKTRIGRVSEEEFSEILELYNRYPIAELIVHPRVQKDFYKYTPHMDAFALAIRESKAPLCYNGDLFTKHDIRRFAEQFPQVDRVMLGRGLISDPGLIAKYDGREVPTKQDLYNFHQALLEQYCAVISGERNQLFKIKELWQCMACIFTDHEKYAKKIRKATSLKAYQRAVDLLFEQQDLRDDSVFEGW